MKRGACITKESLTTTSNGGKTDFYDIVGCTDVDDLAEHWDLRGDELNCLKAIAGIALGSRHQVHLLLEMRINYYTTLNVL